MLVTLPCQKVGDRGWRISSLIHELLRRIQPLCWHTAPAAFSRHELASSLLWVACFEKQKDLNLNAARHRLKQQITQIQCKKSLCLPIQKISAKYVRLPTRILHPVLPFSCQNQQRVLVAVLILQFHDRISFQKQSFTTQVSTNIHTFFSHKKHTFLLTFTGVHCRMTVPYCVYNTTDHQDSDNYSFKYTH